MDPKAAERAITPNTRAILPTHLYGMSCDMSPIMELARKHNLKVIEDCAHSLGATYKGQPTGTFGDGSFFSFQAFKPLNTYGGGLAWVRDADVAKKVWEFADAEEWPSEKRVESIVRTGWWQHAFIRPRVFTLSLFPVWYVASFTGSKPEERLWESVRRLDPLPAHYRGKFSNVQAAIGIAGLKRLPEFIERTRKHAKVYDEMLGEVPGVAIPRIPEGRNHVYYQYCPYVPDYLDLVKRSIRRGVDVAPMHVDHCTTMELFEWKGPATPGAAKAMTAVQMPVYESLSDAEIERIGRLVREQAQQSRQAGSYRVADGRSAK
jgi:dTDP-4-amino-4,6-dideoxygalactose transaminase